MGRVGAEISPLLNLSVIIRPGDHAAVTRSFGSSDIRPPVEPAPVNRNMTIISNPT